MKRLPFGTKKEGSAQAVFTAIMTDSVQPWEFHYVKRVSGIRCPSALVISRWDGSTGFPGGFVDPGETLKEAAVREVFEEIGLEIDPERLEDGYSIANNITIHLFKLVVSEQEYLELLQAAWVHSSIVLGDILTRKFHPKKAKVFKDMKHVNFFTEVNTIEPVHVTEIDNSKCFPRFLQRPFPPTMINQVALLANDHKWADEETLNRWFDEAGYNFEELLLK